MRGIFVRQAYQKLTTWTIWCTCIAHMAALRIYESIGCENRYAREEKYRRLTSSRLSLKWMLALVAWRA